jgi:hypothetical protein
MRSKWLPFRDACQSASAIYWFLLQSQMSQQTHLGAATERYGSIDFAKFTRGTMGPDRWPTFWARGWPIASAIKLAPRRCTEVRICAPVLFHSASGTWHVPKSSTHRAERLASLAVMQREQRGTPRPVYSINVAEISRAKTAIFLRNSNPITPVQPSAQKYFTSIFPKFVFLSPHPASTGGAARDRHGRWRQEAVAVRVCSALMRADENSFTDGEGVWSRSPDAGIKSCEWRCRPFGCDTPVSQGDGG